MYEIVQDHIVVVVHPGLMSLQGALASEKGRGLSFAQNRKVLAKGDRGT